jgi:hypothetical protein
MHRYRCWVRLTQTQTTFVVISADYDSEVRLLADAMYGPGNLISFTRLSR